MARCGGGSSLGSGTPAAARTASTAAATSAGMSPSVSAARAPTAARASAANCRRLTAVITSGIDTWEPAIERARSNVNESGLADRIELRNQSVADLDDTDRFDLTWVPSFFLSAEALTAGAERILSATRSGGQVVVARYNPPPEPLGEAALRLRTVRDGGSWLPTEEIVGILEGAGWSDVRVLPTPPAFSFVAGRKA